VGEGARARKWPTACVERQEVRPVVAVPRPGQGFLPYVRQHFPRTKKEVAKIPFVRPEWQAHTGGSLPITSSDGLFFPQAAIVGHWNRRGSVNSRGLPSQPRLRASTGVRHRQAGNIVSKERRLIMWRAISSSRHIGPGTSNPRACNNVILPRQELRYSCPLGPWLHDQERIGDPPQI